MNTKEKDLRQWAELIALKRWDKLSHSDCQGIAQALREMADATLNDTTLEIHVIQSKKICPPNCDHRYNAGCQLSCYDD